MRYRKLDENGDMVFGNGQASFLRDSPECVAQACMTRLTLWRGEWFLNVDEGTPYLQGVIGKHDELTRDTVMRARILGTEGLKKILEYESINDRDNRKLNLTTKIDTIYGETTIQEVI